MRLPVASSAPPSRQRILPFEDCWPVRSLLFAFIGTGSSLSVAAGLNFLPLTELPSSCCVTASRRYRNPPLGPQDQPDFVNAAAGLLTRLTIDEFMAEMKALEARLGRARKQGDRWGPRLIDLDLLVFGAVTRNSDSLTVPHSGISERNFVLFPLRDIAPLLVVPGEGVVAQLAAQQGSEGLEPLD